MREYLNDKWYFKAEFREEYKKEVPVETFEKIRIPHTVKEIPLNYVNNEDYQMISAYYTELDLSAYQGKHCSLVFEGVAHLCEVYLNGELCAVHKSGYTAFRVEIEESRKRNRLKVLVKVDSRESLNIPPFGNVIDYLTYGGIYRDVYLEVRNPSHIEDVFVRADADKTLTLDLTYHELKPEQKVRVKIANINEEGEARSRYCFKDLDVKLWEVDEPNLYPLKLELLQNNQVIDALELEVGFRSIDSDVNGIYLNGKKIKLRGLNRHQSYAYVGYAMPERVERQDARILKYELGLNAVRTSHYPNSHDFISECDRIGLLVLTEIPGWQHIGDKDWQDVAVLNVEEMVMQYRNHPSIFMWGVRINESMDHHELYTRTNEVARKLDDTRLIGGIRCIENSELLEDVYTFNDFIHNGTNEGIRKRSRVTDDKKKALLVTEYNGHMYPTKMIDDEVHRTNHVKRHFVVLNAVAGSEEHAGSFGWCMADYNTHRDFGSGDQICYHGVLDIFRNKKPAAHVYSSQKEDEVILEINSSLDIGDYPAGLIRDVVIMTNCEKIRFYQGDEMMGEFYPSDTYGNLQHPPIWIDEISGNWGDKSKGFRIEGIIGDKVVKELVIQKFEQLMFKVKSDTSELKEGKSYDVASVRIEATNQAGNHLFYFNEALRIEVSGEVELIGPKLITLKGGFGGFYVKSKGKGSGNVKIYYNEEVIKELHYSVSSTPE